MNRTFGVHDREQLESSNSGPDRDRDPNKPATYYNKQNRLTKKAEKVKGTAIAY